MKAKNKSLWRRLLGFNRNEAGFTALETAAALAIAIAVCWTIDKAGRKVCGWASSAWERYSNGNKMQEGTNLDGTQSHTPSASPSPSTAPSPHASPCPNGGGALQDPVPPGGVSGGGSAM